MATGEVIQYIISDKTKSTPIGSIYFCKFDADNRSAELGIFIGEDNYIGKGYGSQAAKLFVKFGFENLKLHRIYLRLLANNNIAYNSYRKVGFIKEGVARDLVMLDGEYTDIIFMSILEEGIKL